MTDSFQFDKFIKWHKRNPNIFHWTVTGGVVEIISMSAEIPTQKDARRLASALRYRGADASVSYRTVYIRNRFNLGKFMDALRAVNIDWEDFETWVSMLYFDGKKHITDRAVKS